MKSYLRILIILIMALLSGVIYNQIYPAGIHWRILIPRALLIPAGSSSDIQIILADSAAILHHQDEIEFIDTRPRVDYDIDHIAGAVNLSFEQILQGEISRIKIESRPLLCIYDQEGDHENMQIAAKVLFDGGARRIYILFGGYLAWLGKGFPVEGGR